MQQQDFSDVPAWPWHSLPAVLLQDLIDTLVASLVPDTPVYLLVDPLLGDLETPIDQAARPRYAVPWETMRLPANRLPYLIEFENAQDAFLAQSLEWAGHEHLRLCALGSGACRVGGWLQAHKPHEGPALARGLAALFRASGAPGHGRYLRLADRRVLSLIQRAADASLIPAFDWTESLQGIASWSYLDAAFRLQTLRGQDGPMAERPLRLMPEHWQLMTHAEAINRSLTVWQGRCNPLPDQALAMAMDVLQRARQRGLREPEDLAAYAVEALCSANFEQWPDLPKHIAACVQTGQPLTQRFEALRRETSDKRTWATH